MKYYEKLQALIGHEVIITTFLKDDEREIPPGDIIEVGEDYLVLKTKAEEEGGFALEGAEWFLGLDKVIHIIHQSDCKKCAIAETEKTLRPVKKQA